MKTLKINSEIKCANHFQNNTSFVKTNEKSLYFFQNYVLKTISILSNIANSLLLASNSNSMKGRLDHVNIVKSCVNGIAVLGYISAEFDRKRKNNLQNIVHAYFVTLCGPKPESDASKVKPKNFPSVFLLGANLEQAAEDAKNWGRLQRKIPTGRMSEWLIGNILKIIHKSLP